MRKIFFLAVLAFLCYFAYGTYQQKAARKPKNRFLAFCACMADRKLEQAATYCSRAVCEETIKPIQTRMNGLKNVKGSDIQETMLLRTMEIQTMDRQVKGYDDIDVLSVKEGKVLIKVVGKGQWFRPTAAIKFEYKGQTGIYVMDKIGGNWLLNRTFASSPLLQAIATTTGDVPEMQSGTSTPGVLGEHNSALQQETQQNAEESQHHRKRRKRKY